MADVDASLDCTSAKKSFVAFIVREFTIRKTVMNNSTIKKYAALAALLATGLVSQMAFAQNVGCNRIGTLRGLNKNRTVQCADRSASVAAKLTATSGATLTYRLTVNAKSAGVISASATITNSNGTSLTTAVVDGNTSSATFTRAFRTVSASQNPTRVKLVAGDGVGN